LGLWNPLLQKVMGQLRFVAMEHTRTQRADLARVLGMVESASGVHALSKINNRASLNIG
jgi:hypothetical protein